MPKTWGTQRKADVPPAEYLEIETQSAWNLVSARHVLLLPAEFRPSRPQLASVRQRPSLAHGIYSWSLSVRKPCKQIAVNASSWNRQSRPFERFKRLKIARPHFLKIRKRFSAVTALKSAHVVPKTSWMPILILVSAAVPPFEIEKKNFLASLAFPNRWWTYLLGDSRPARTRCGWSARKSDLEGSINRCET